MTYIVGNGFAEMHRWLFIDFVTKSRKSKMKVQIIDLEGTITTVHLQALPVMEDAGGGSRTRSPTQRNSHTEGLSHRGSPTRKVSHTEGLPHGGTPTQRVSYMEGLPQRVSYMEGRRDSHMEGLSHTEGLPHGGSLTQSVSYVVFCAVLLQRASST